MSCIALAADAGLEVVINTIIENAPYWLEERRPDARYVDSEDRPVHLTAAMNTPGGGWPGLCFDDDRRMGRRPRSSSRRSRSATDRIPP